MVEELKDPRITRMHFEWHTSDDLPNDRNVSVSVGPKHWRIATRNMGLESVFCLTDEAMRSVISQFVTLCPKRDELAIIEDLRQQEASDD